MHVVPPVGWGFTVPTAVWCLFHFASSLTTHVPRPHGFASLFWDGLQLLLQVFGVLFGPVVMFLTHHVCCNVPRVGYMPLIESQAAQKDFCSRLLSSGSFSWRMRLRSSFGGMILRFPFLWDEDSDLDCVCNLDPWSGCVHLVRCVLLRCMLLLPCVQLRPRWRVSGPWTGAAGGSTELQVCSEVQVMHPLSFFINRRDS